MSDDLRFERTARTWLEIGPDEAPRGAVEAALLTIESTPQERGGRLPWRSTTMNTATRLAAVAAVIALAVLGAAFYLGQGHSQVGGPAVPTPTACPSAATGKATPSGTAVATPVAIPPMDQWGVFVSPTMGYSIAYPPGAVCAPATKPWLPGTTTLWGDPTVDLLLAPGVRLVGSSQPLAAGQSADDWIRAYLAVQTPCTGERPAPEAATIDGQQGVIDQNGCSTDGFGGIVPGGRLFDAFVVKGDRGYQFTLDGNVDHAYFLAVLGTIKLNPASAVDASVLPSSSP